VLRPNLQLAALEVEGTGLGLVGLRADAWRPLAGSYALCGVEAPLSDAASSESDGTELVVLRIRPATHPSEGTPYWPLDLRLWRPVRGERVLALGFADLDVEEGSEERPISQYPTWVHR
jgi:hypothetical protein